MKLRQEKKAIKKQKQKHVKQKGSIIDQQEFSAAGSSAQAL